MDVSVQAQLDNPLLSQICLPNGDVVIFNNLILSNSGITYDQTTGVFTLLSAGTYLVIWTLAVDGSFMAPSVKFALSVNGTAMTPSSSPVSHGSITNAQLVKTTTLDVALSLINHTDDTVCLASVDIPANIIITKISGSCSDDPVADLIYSIAQEELSLSNIISAEALKIRTAISIPNVSVQDLLCINESVSDTLDRVAHIESLLVRKLKSGLSSGKECNQ